MIVVDTVAACQTIRLNNLDFIDDIEGCKFGATLCNLFKDCLFGT